MIIKTLIIDEDPSVRDAFCYQLKVHEHILVAGEAGTFREARAQLIRQYFDLVFLEPGLETNSGFDLLPYIDLSSHLVFVTDRRDWAIRAFQANAMDFLLKPVCPKQLARSIAGIKFRKLLAPENPGPKGIFVKRDSEKKYIFFNDIQAIRSIGGNYLNLYLKSNEKVICRGTLRAWEAFLNHNLFLRIHRSTIIRLDRVRQICSQKNGTLHLSISDLPEIFTVSRRMASRLKDFVRQYGPLSCR